MASALAVLLHVSHAMILLSCFVWPHSGHAQAESSRRRGRFLRNDVVKTEKEPSLLCTLAPTNSPFPVLRFRKQEHVTFQEVAVYEVLVPEEPEAEESDFTGVAYRVLPDEEMRGESTKRTVSRDVGPLANATVNVGDRTVTTDAKGLFVDEKQLFLKPFDDLSINTWETTVQHDELGTAPLTLSRYLTRRWEDEDNETRIRMMQTDILAATGLHYEPLSPSDHAGLQLSVEIPESVRPGENITVTVTATNKGNKAVSCLLGRLFSRHEWLSRINIYIGNIPPGETRSFKRILDVPEQLQVGQTIYAVLGFWDVRGAVKGAARRIRIDPTGAVE